MTNQTENGNSESVTDKWENVSEIIANYFGRIRLKSREPDGVIEKILGMPIEELKTLNSDECGEYAFALSQYSIFLQKEINYHESKTSWCEDNLSYMIYNIRPRFAEDTFTKVLEKAAILASKHKVVKELLFMHVQAKVINKNLNSMSKHIDNITKILMNLQQSKRVYKNGG